MSGYTSSAKEWKTKRASSLVDAVTQHLGHKDDRPQLTPLDLIELGCVYVNNHRAIEASQRVKTGDLLRVHSFPRRFQIPADLKRRIVAEAENYLVIEKPANLPTEPIVDNLRENLLFALRQLLGSSLYSVFELDIETAGLVVFAKSEDACEQYKLAFKEGRVARKFIVFTEKEISQANSTESIRVLSVAKQGSETALINEGQYSWSVIGETLKSFFRVEIEQTSGRPLEIRDHLASLGAPIIGDVKRNSSKALKDNVTGKAALAWCPVSIRL